jgi:hypothetical protein
MVASIMYELKIPSEDKPENKPRNRKEGNFCINYNLGAATPSPLSKPL